MRKFPSIFLICIAVYGLLLLVATLLLPLRLGEILHAAVLEHFTWDRFFRWIALTPGSAPLGYLLQLPALGARHSLLALRLPSLLFAIGSCYLFFRLANLVPLRRHYWALLVFLALPVHYYFASQARPFEQGLFLLLLATLLFFRLVESPAVPIALLYGTILTACLYTEPACFLPAIGYVLFLLRFAHGRAERHALWFALPATAIPALLFAWYYAWARSRTDLAWLNEPAQADELFSQAVSSLVPGDWGLALGVPLALLLLAGLIIGAWSTFPPIGMLTGGRPPVPPALQRRRILLFCLSGGASVTILADVLIDFFSRMPFSPNEILWAVPSLVVLFFAATESLADAALPKIPSPGGAILKPALRVLSPVLAGLLVALSLSADIGYLRKPPGDVQAMTDLIPPELTGDACVVFVSEHLSRYILLLFHPEIEKSECHNFFHQRVVMASHPYVTPVQQRNAEQYFRGLNFVVKKRQQNTGGQVITLEADK